MALKPGHIPEKPVVGEVVLGDLAILPDLLVVVVVGHDKAIAVAP